MFFLRLGIDSVVVALSLGIELWPSGVVFNVGVWCWGVLWPVTIVFVAAAPAPEVMVGCCDLVCSGFSLGVIWALWFAGGGIDCVEA